MIVSLTKENNSSLISLIGSYKRELTNPTLKYSQAQKIADHLGEILQDHPEFHHEIVEMLDVVETIEKNGQQNDQKLLVYFNKLDLELKQLELQIETLIPSVIEEKLKDLEIWLQSLQKQHSYQDAFFKKEMYKLQTCLHQLMFVFHFPLYGQVKNKNVPLLKIAMDLFLNRKKSILIGNRSLEKAIEKKTGKSLKELMKHPSSRQMLIPHFIIEHVYSQQTVG